MYRIILFCCLILQTSVTLAQSPTRIVSVGAGVTELLFALGAKSQVVAVDSTSRRFASENHLPVLGYQRHLTTEGVLSLQPDYLIGSSEMGPENVLQQLAQAGVKVIKLDNPHNNVKDLMQHIEQLGQLLDKPQQAEQLLADIQQQLAQFTSQAPQGLTGLGLVLAENNIMASGQDSTMASMFNLLHIDNLANQQANYYPYSTEQILLQQPKVLLVAQRSLSQDLDETLNKYPFLNQLSAVKNQCIFTVDGQALLGGFNLTTLAETQRIMQGITTHHCL
ncbi:heme/hemin ABC transporter substrate-binding protein [Volucribacter amazonae]|uniref:Fe/B12 periplasmic-binding domain-containing protein n=1 Tax=Volucribacter amazonae TaxID=256731 RepID=A0A9X4SKN7_9PAST|nr:ABC transporter substrate-binding protein [Volucribacter amazonae]MDG6895304.1 hypothetical protein [Volucribacter amazonae]